MSSGPKFGKFGLNKRRAYLKCLREGQSRTTAARAAGVSPELVRLYRHARPGWSAKEDSAEIEASGQVEDALFAAAKGGNVVACQVWLYNRRSERWSDKRNPPQPLPPLEVILATLPREAAEIVRRALSEALQPGANPSSPPAKPAGDDPSPQIVPGLD